MDSSAHARGENGAPACSRPLQARPQSVTDAPIPFRKSQDLSMLRKINNLGLAIGSVWHALRAYFGAYRWKRAEPIADRDALRRFLESRASYVTQTSLYGYLRTRAGMRYPQLFAD